MARFDECQKYWFNYLTKFQQKHKKRLKNSHPFSLIDKRKGDVQKQVIYLKNLRFEKKQLRQQFKEASVFSLDIVISNPQPSFNQEDFELTSYSLFNTETGEDLFTYSSVIDNEHNESETVLLIFDKIIVDSKNDIADLGKLIQYLEILQQKYPCCKIN